MSRIHSLDITIKTFHDEKQGNYRLAYRGVVVYEDNEHWRHETEVVARCVQVEKTEQEAERTASVEIANQLEEMGLLHKYWIDIANYMGKSLFYRGDIIPRLTIVVHHNCHGKELLDLLK